MKSRPIHRTVSAGSHSGTQLGWLLILIGHNYWHTYARALFGQSMRWYTFAVVLPHVRARDVVVVAVGSSRTRRHSRPLPQPLGALT